MSRDGLRVMALAIASIAMIVASTLALSWFVATIEGAADVSKITFDLREARACTEAGPCGVVPMSKIRGFYPTSAGVAFFSSLLFAALVMYQAGSRVLTGYAGETLTRLGYGLSTIVILASVGAGYLFGPDIGGASMMGFGIVVERDWGPLTMLGGVIIGDLALYLTKSPDMDDVGYKPLDPSTVASARAKTSTTPPAMSYRPRAPTTPPPTAVPAPVVSRTKTPTTPPVAKRPSLGLMPAQLKGKVQFSVVTGDISVAGIDARREDGSTVLVLWRDVVGLVARRLPPDLDGHPFIDIVSTKGMTLRILPWSKLTGEPIEGDAEARMRMFVKLVVPRCPECRLDRATQAFVDSTKSPAQLPTTELLAKHDQALA